MTEYEDPPGPPHTRQPNEALIDGGNLQIIWYGNRKIEGKAARYGRLILEESDEPGGPLRLFTDCTDREDPYLGGVAEASSLAAAIEKLTLFVRYKT